MESFFFMENILMLFLAGIYNAVGGAELLFAVANVAEHLLQRGGLLALETGAGGQAAQLVAHLEKQQQQQQCGGVWTDAHVRLDYARSERFVFARRA